VEAGMKVYLCGPINGCADEEAKDWREYSKAHLKADAYDPMVRDYRGRELEPGIAREIVKNDKLDINECDALLVFYEKPSVGTSMEVLYAHQLGKEIVVVNKSDKPISPWLLYHSHALFLTLDSAINHLNEQVRL
jgi:nucleoside 2-deoxyribosyltransferase